MRLSKKAIKAFRNMSKRELAMTEWAAFWLNYHDIITDARFNAVSRRTNLSYDEWDAMHTHVWRWPDAPKGFPDD